MTKTRNDLVRAWCEKGRRDFITAHKALLDESEIFPDIICFHAQQAAENLDVSGDIREIYSVLKENYRDRIC